VKIRRTKIYTPRQFTIVPNDGPLNYISLYNKYVGLRPKNVKIDNPFLSYHGGKCTSQPVGKNTLGKTPRIIAEFLKLPDANKFTGHCFRRSAATMLAENGGDTRSLKQLGGWRSDKVAESYVKNYLQNKIKNAQIISSEGSINIRKWRKY
jgi:integrase